MLISRFAQCLSKQILNHLATFLKKNFLRSLKKQFEQ